MEHSEFAQRTEQIRARLYRTAYLYLGSQADALEAVDEAVYRALCALGKLRQPEYFEAWLTRILVNECHRELRRKKRLAEEPLLPESAGADAYDNLPLKEAIRRLPEPLRQVVILRYFSGYTLAETASILDVPAGTVSTRQRRALELLRLELREEDGHESQ
jgi:RNA polymerase sigma factor (sigma-70 family)